MSTLVNVTTIMIVVTVIFFIYLYFESGLTIEVHEDRLVFHNSVRHTEGEINAPSGK